MIVPHSHDETAYLCEQFDDMYEQLKENTKQMVLSGMLLEKAEYNSLLAQMNPHFLYNTLESVSAMAKLSDACFCGSQHLKQGCDFPKSFLLGDQCCQTPFPFPAADRIFHPAAFSR